MSLALDARRLLRSQRHATLGTLSTALAGYPYCSVVPYVLDHEARPVMLVSRLAEHTHNVAHDPRVCLFAHEGAADVQTGRRVTLMGKAQHIAGPDAGTERYARFFPQATAYREALDFDYYRIEPVSLRVVAGFAKVHWISREAYTPKAGDFVVEEPRLVADLNLRCASALRAYCSRQLETDAEGSAIVGIDCDGFDLAAGGRYWRLAFAAPVSSASEAASSVERILRSPAVAP
jgi:heme iron utilization protein